MSLRPDFPGMLLSLHRRCGSTGLSPPQNGIAHLATCLICPLLGFWISLSMLRVSTMINFWSPEGKEANPIRRIPKRDVTNPSNTDDWSTDAFSSSWVFSSKSLERHSLRDDWKRVFPLWGGLLIYSIVRKPPGSVRVDHRSLLEAVSLASKVLGPSIPKPGCPPSGFFWEQVIDIPNGIGYLHCGGRYGCTTGRTQIENRLAFDCYLADFHGYEPLKDRSFIGPWGPDRFAVRSSVS